MKLAIRNQNGIYIDKNFDRLDKEGNRLFPDEVLTQEPYNYTIIELDDKYADCETVDFNDDLTFNVEKYNARHSKQEQDGYVEKVVALIRQRYTMNDEFAILRQRDTKPEEFAEYNAFVEECKRKAKEPEEE